MNVRRALFPCVCQCSKHCTHPVRCSAFHCLKQWHAPARRRIIRGIAIALLLAPGFGLIARAQTAPTTGQQRSTAANARFATVDVVVDSGRIAMAAYQFELTFAGGGALIVGVEGGEHAAFAGAPYYDPAALHGEGRIIIAAFSTSEALSAGRTRVARVHMQMLSEQMPEPSVQLIVAGAADGSPIEATATAAYAEGN